MTAFTYFCSFHSASSDNGIDIFGFYKGHVLIVQCKDYTGSVGKCEIRGFEGALSR